jgi:hypothetical protein
LLDGFSATLMEMVKKFITDFNLFELFDHLIVTGFPIKAGHHYCKAINGGGSTPCTTAKRANLPKRCWMPW